MNTFEMLFNDIKHSIGTLALDTHFPFSSCHPALWRVDETRPLSLLKNYLWHHAVRLNMELKILQINAS